MWCVQQKQYSLRVSLELLYLSIIQDFVHLYVLPGIEVKGRHTV